MFQKRITNAMHVQYLNMPKTTLRLPADHIKGLRHREGVKLRPHHDKKYIISVSVCYT